MSTLWHKSPSLTSYIIYGNALAYLVVIAAFTGYILESRELAPVKAIVLGAATMVAGYLIWSEWMSHFPAHMPVNALLLFSVLFLCRLNSFWIGLNGVALRFYRKHKLPAALWEPFPG